MNVNGYLKTAQIETFTSGTIPVASQYASRAIYLSDTKQFLISTGTVWLSPAILYGTASAKPSASSTYLYQFYFETDTGYLKMCVPVSSTPTWVTVNGAPPAGSITNAMLGTGIVGQANLASRSTGSTVGAGGIAVSSSSGAFSTTSTTAVSVTNLSVTLTTLGRPVMLMVIPDGSGVAAIGINSSGARNTCWAEYLLSSSGGNVYTSAVYTGSNNTTINLINYTSPALLNALDIVAAGTYTYSVSMLVAPNTSQTGYCNYCKLVAYEL